MARCCSDAVARDIGLLLIRVPLGVLFFLAGLGKFNDGMAKTAIKHFESTKAFMPESLGWAFLYALPFAEMIVGLLLALGLLARIGGLIGMLMLISFMMAMTWAKHDGPLDSNVVFAGIAAGVLFCGPGRISIDSLLFRMCKCCRKDEPIDPAGGNATIAR